MRFFNRKGSDLESELENLEMQLYRTLNPVAPRPHFLQELKSRLLMGEMPSLSSKLPQRISNVLLIIGGIIGSILMVIASVRGILTLINSINENSQKQQITPA